MPVYASSKVGLLKQLILLFACCALCACGSEERAARTTILDELKDPGSAQFADFTVSKQRTVSCVGVNAKNSMGGYVGEEQWYLWRRSANTPWTSFIPVKQSHAACAEAVNRLEQHLLTTNEWPDDSGGAMNAVDAIYGR